MRRLVIALCLLCVAAVPSFAAPSFLHQATVTLTNDQIVHLPSSPITLIPAQGANRLIVPVYLNVKQKFPSTTYEADTTASLYLSINGRVASEQIDISGSFGSTQDFLAMLNISQAYVVSDALYISVLDGVVNQPLSLSAWNGGLGDFGGGTAVNTLPVSVVYLILNTSTGAFE